MDIILRGSDNGSVTVEKDFTVNGNARVMNQRPPPSRRIYTSISLTTHCSFLRASLAAFVKRYIEMGLIIYGSSGYRSRQQTNATDV